MRERRARTYGTHENVRELWEGANARETYQKRMVVVHGNADGVVGATPLPPSRTDVPSFEGICVVEGESTAKGEILDRHQVVRERVDSDQLRANGLVRLEAD